MTVHTSGVLALTASDFKTTHLGVEIGVKVVAWTGIMPVVTMVEKKGAVYEATHILYEFDDSHLPEVVTAAAGGTVNWIKTVLLPRINTALAARFKPTGTTIPPTTSAAALAEIDSQLGALLAWKPQVDGTLLVAVK